MEDNKGDNMRTLSKQEAREYLVTYQMINTSLSLSGKEGVLYVMNKLKSIQYDPLDVVGKNTDLVLQARVADYKRPNPHRARTDAPLTYRYRLQLQSSHD